MAEGKIKCPHCGREAFVVPENLNESDLTYTCSNCHREFTVAFFDHCPQCHKNVGFLDNYGFNNDMKSIGSDIVDAIVNPWSIVSNIGATVLDSYLNKSISATGDGECPYCHNRYIRCGHCNELMSIDKKATYKDIFRCKCGAANNPNGTTKEAARRHSSKFYSFSSNTPSFSSPVPTYIPNRHDRKRETKNKQNKDKTPQITTYCTEINYTPTKLMSILAEIENQKRWTGDSIILCDKERLKSTLESKYKIKISSSQLSKFNTYRGFVEFVTKRTKPEALTAPVKTDEGNNNKVQKELKDIKLRNAVLCAIKECTKQTSSNTESSSVSPDHKFHVSLAIKGLSTPEDKLINCRSNKEVIDLVIMNMKQTPEIIKQYISNQSSQTSQKNIDNQTNQTSQSPGNSIEGSEQEYLDEVKECLADGEIGPRERRLLDKIREKLGISPERATELEETLSAPQLTDDEKEYLTEFKECAIDGIVTDKERRLLEKMRNMLGISEERAKELERM